jgi:RimJ/RimL family protein N-acetyltransferase
MNNREINTYLQNEQEGTTREHSISWIERHQNDYTFSMLDANTNEFIGNCSIHDIENNSGEIGIFISPTFQNIGLGTEAITELIRIGFNELNLEEIRLIVFSHNEPPMMYFCFYFRPLGNNSQPKFWLQFHYKSYGGAFVR